MSCIKTPICTQHGGIERASAPFCHAMVADNGLILHKLWRQWLALIFFFALVAADTNQAVFPRWNGKTERDLHNEYNTIFRYGNRNAASHLWRLVH
jgi:hypothetical protein